MNRTTIQTPTCGLPEEEIQHLNSAEVPHSIYTLSMGVPSRAEKAEQSFRHPIADCLSRSLRNAA